MIERIKIATTTHENVWRFVDKEINLDCIIALHDTTCGPAFGGCRIKEYKLFESALEDALLLSSAMTFKSAFYELPFGGGKSVINGIPENDQQKKQWFDTLALLLNDLSGKYHTADDMGTTVDDMAYMRNSTVYARGVRDSNGKQVPATSYGVYLSIKAAVEHLLHKKSLRNIRVAIQGVGKVGWELCRLLKNDGAILIVSDTISERAEAAKKEFGAKIVAPDEIVTQDVDIFCPCGAGNIINSNLLSDIKTKIIVGAANNPLQHDDVAFKMHDKNILYIPDFVSNAGGVIDVLCEGDRYSEEYVLQAVNIIYDKTKKLLDYSSCHRLVPLFAAKQMAYETINSRKSKCAVYPGYSI